MPSPALPGDRAAAETAAPPRPLFGCAAEHVFVGSTGVIGEPLPTDKLLAVLPQLVSDLGRASWQDAAGAIATTDTFAKAATATAVIDGVPVTIVGIAKGAGMIAPDMATMLCYVFTDAAIRAGRAAGAADRRRRPLLQLHHHRFRHLDQRHRAGLRHRGVGPCPGQRCRRCPARPVPAGAERSSCSISPIRWSRTARGSPSSSPSPSAAPPTRRPPAQIALSVANSPLVKTAIAGEDANWGRIVMAVGKSGAAIDRGRLAISIGGTAVARDGAPLPGYDEAPVAAHMRGREVTIAIDVGVGDGSATVWTCDLTHGYIDINASYRS